MKLKDFIKASLQDICDGISEAQIELDEKSGSAPIAPGFIDGKPVYNKTTYTIDFDIAIAIAETDSSQIGGNINSGGILQVVGVNLGADGYSTSGSTKEQHNRIKFSVPYYPQALRGTKNKPYGK